MDDFPISDESASAITDLAGVIDKIAPGNGLRDELTVAIRVMIDCRITDAIEVLADRIQDSIGIRP